MFLCFQKEWNEKLFQLLHSLHHSFKELSNYRGGKKINLNTWPRFVSPPFLLLIRYEPSWLCSAICHGTTITTLYTTIGCSHINQSKIKTSPWSQANVIKNCTYRTLLFCLSTFVRIHQSLMIISLFNQLS